jgi:putative FmdB family regulatory protein
MPTYEYRCPEGHDFERFFRKISDAPADVACPQCGKIAERKMSAGAGLLFKGSGFYLTDYGKNAHRTSGDAPSGSAKGESSGGEGKGGEGKGGESKGGESSGTKSEAKSESKSESKSSEAKPAAPAPAAPAPKNSKPDK